jgi:hypothetical protein
LRKFDFFKNQPNVLDIGYGNYVLTAPVERNRRDTDKFDNKFDNKFDASDLLSASNTLTNPNARKQKIEL